MKINPKIPTHILLKILFKLYSTLLDNRMSLLFGQNKVAIVNVGFAVLYNF